MKKTLQIMGWFVLLIALFFVLTVNNGCTKNNTETVQESTENDDAKNPLLEIDFPEDPGKNPVPQNSSEGSNSDDN